MRTLIITKTVSSLEKIAARLMWSSRGAIELIGLGDASASSEDLTSERNGTRLAFMPAKLHTHDRTASILSHLSPSWHLLR